MRRDVEQALQIMQGNDPAALEKAIESLQDTVFSFSMKVCGHPQDAEDTMQDVLIKLLPLPAYVSTIRRRSRSGCTKSRATAASSTGAAQTELA